MVSIHCSQRHGLYPLRVVNDMVSIHGRTICSSKSMKRSTNILRIHVFSSMYAPMCTCIERENKNYDLPSDSGCMSLNVCYVISKYRKANTIYSINFKAIL